MALGYVHLLDREKVTLPKKRLSVDEVEAEVEKFDQALEQAKKQLVELRKRFSEEQGDEHIYLIDAQQLMLEDKSLTEDTRETIQNERINSEWALQKSIERFRNMFNRIDDEYFRDRRSDIEYIEERLLRILVGSREQEYVSLQRQALVIAHDLAPADMVKLNRDHLVGFVTDTGGRTSHTVIIARSLGIPMVVGMQDFSIQVENGDRIIVDGSEGLVVLNPSSETWAEYEKRRESFLDSRKELLQNRHHKAETKDEFHIRLMSNIDFVEEVPAVINNGSEGVGLLRTEHLFLGGTIPISEEEQFRHYKEVVESIRPQNTIIRLLDLPGDQIFSLPNQLATSRSSALGIRGIRLLTKEPEIFRPQIRAILRASAFGKVSLMYPMVSCVEEVREANAFVAEVMDELSNEGIEYDSDIAIGSMIEIPSAALMADEIAKEVSFLSIGTNDLLQYTLAVERGNELVANLYEPLNRAHIQLISQVVRMAHKAGKEVGVCGEVGGEPYFIPLLVGLEVNFLSMSPGSISLAKQVIRDLTVSEAKKWLEEVLRLETTEDIKNYLNECYGQGLRSGGN